MAEIPKNATGLRLCKITGSGELVLCESVIFKRGKVGVETVLRRAAISGLVGDIGETGDFWADIIDENGSWSETVALDRAAWNTLKNRLMRCRIEKEVA